MNATPPNGINPNDINLINTLDITFTQIHNEYIEAVMPVSEKICQVYGILHGGASLALAESVAGFGSNRICFPRKAVGTQVSANHLQMVKIGDTVTAKGTLIHQGKTLHLWSVDLVSNTTGKTITTARITNMILE